MQKSLSSVLPKRVYPVSMRMHSKSTQRKLASHKKTSRGKVSRRSLVTIAKNNLEAKKKRSVVRKRIATNSHHFTSRDYSFVLIWNSLFSSQVLCKSVTTQSLTKQELQKYEAEQPPTYQIDSLKRDINKKLWQIRLPDRQDFILFSHQAFEFANNEFGRCWMSFNLRFYSTFASKKRRRSRHLLYFTRRCRNIILSSF